MGIVWPGARLPWVLRFRAGWALRAYEKAESRFFEIENARNWLHERQLSLMQDYAERWVAERALDPEDHAVYREEAEQIAEQLIRLSESWNEAVKALALTYEAAQGVLRDFGYAPEASPGPEGTRSPHSAEVTGGPSGTKPRCVSAGTAF